jgi:flavin reductase (DIM6/NTAB) family NADH-FMN oxidoreductase RutF
MPSGIYLLGSAAGGRRNLMTHNWAVQVSLVPKLMAVSVRNDALTHELIAASGVFSLCFLKREDRAMVRTFTKPAEDGPAPGMLGGQLVREGSTGAPVLARSAAWLECEVRHQMGVGDHTIFIGEIVDCSAPDEESPVLRMEDTRLNYGG